MCRVGQTIHIRCTLYIQYFWLGHHQIYGHKLCIYTVLANPNYVHITSQNFQAYLKSGSLSFAQLIAHPNFSTRWTVATCWKEAAMSALTWIIARTVKQHA